MTRYSPVNRYIPKLEDLYEDAEMLLKGYGFSEDEIHREYPLGNTLKKIDMAGVKDGFSVGIEIGRCSPERMFECVKYFDRVIWLPYWFTVIEDKSIRDEAHETRREKSKMIESMNNILTKANVLLNFNKRVQVNYYLTLEDAVNFISDAFGRIEKFHRFLGKEMKRWGL